VRIFSRGRIGRGLDDLAGTTVPFLSVNRRHTQARQGNERRAISSIPFSLAPTKAALLETDIGRRW